MFPELTRDDVFRIETRRLWLRWPRLEDAEDIAREAGKPEVAEMTARIPVGMNRQQAESLIARGRARNEAGTAIWLALNPLDNPEQVIGIVSILVEEGHAPEFGYWLAQPFWGSGLTTEAAQALVDVFFAVTPLEVLGASALPYNAASRRVLKKCGFALVGNGLAEAPARGGPQAVDFFRLDRSTWAALKGWREPHFQRQDGSSEAQRRQQMQMAAK
jgi:RimJ/RimL family protein N-acetyltransferase